MEIIGYILRSIGILLVGGIGLFALVILLGDEIFWNFQATGNCEAFTGNKVKIKLKSTNKKGTFIQVRQRLKPEFSNKKITLLLNGELIATSEGSKKTKSTAPFNIPITIAKPKKGHIVVLNIDDKPMMSARIS